MSALIGGLMLKKCLIIGIIITMLLSFIGCSSPSSEAEKAFEEAINALKNNNQEAFERYFEDEIYEAPVSENETTLALLFYENLEYKVISSEKADNIEYLEVNITNLDLASIVPKFFAKAMIRAFSDEGQNMSAQEMDDRLNQIMIELIEELEKTNTHTVTVTMVKGDDDNWRVRADDALMDAVLGGMMTAMDDFNHF